MYRRIWTCLFILAAAHSSCAMTYAQDLDALIPSQPIDIFQPGPDVSTPEIIPDLSPVDWPQHCRSTLKGKVVLGAILDAQGKPRNLRFIEPVGDDLDRLALGFADRDRFKPALQNGQPVAVAQKIELKMTGCLVEETRNDGTKLQTLRLKRPPEQTLLPYPEAPRQTVYGADASANNLRARDDWHPFKIGTDVTEPKLLKYVDAKYSEEARRKNIQDTVVLSLIIDSNGIPRNIQVVRSVGSGLDENAILAVKRYRFTPAEHAGRPVAVTIKVQCNFRLR